LVIFDRYKYMDIRRAGLVIGGGNGASSPPGELSAGFVMEVVIYNRVLSLVERQNLEG
jgi:hypothetical protein